MGHESSEGWGGWDVKSSRGYGEMYHRVGNVVVLHEGGWEMLVDGIEIG